MSDDRTIYQRMADVMAEVEAVKKGRSSGVNYEFRSVDAVFNEVHDLLGKHGVVPSPRVLTDPPPRVELVETTDRNGNARAMTVAVFMLCVDLYAPDGSSMTWGPGMAQSHDYGDKAVYQAQQNAFKYLVLEGLMIPTEDMRANDMDGRNTDEISPAESTETASRSSDDCCALARKGRHTASCPNRPDDT